MSKSLFGTAMHQALAAPQPGGAGTTQVAPTPLPGSYPTPTPGPNAFEVMVVSYDPDSQMLVARFKDGPGAQEMELVTDFSDPGLQQGSVVVALGDNMLAPSVVLAINPRKTPPKFTSVEEAEKWLEENS